MKQIPYKDTYLTFYHYKEPLKVVDGGFGYQGALLSTIDGTQVQCHICGELFADVGRHAISSHKEIVPTVRDYKERFGLAYSTALISESERDRRKMLMIKQWSRYTPEQRDRLRARIRKAAKKWHEARAAHKRRQPKITLETKNKRGTCPDQLLEKVNKCAADLGHTPSKAEFIDYCKGSQRYVHLISATFGSWTEAVKLAGLSAREHAQSSGRRIYSDEELLDALSLFQQENQKIPSYTDSRRGLLPDAGIYQRRFGSLPKARKLAGIRERPTRWGVVPA